jgi:acyl-CoA synthetase (AMP-forming)/AMP-acid ligase II/acyl carrier protein
MTNLISILNHRAEQTPEQIAYIFLEDGNKQRQKISYRQLSQNAKSIAACLQALVSQGSRALLLYPQGLDFISAFLGCLYAGIIAVPAYPPKSNQKMTRLESIIKDSTPRIILTTSHLLENTKNKLTNVFDLSDIQWLTTDNANISEASNWILPNSSNDSLALLQYTSGSTGTPKGVMISHENIIYNSGYIQEAGNITTSDIAVSWLPTFHDMGLIFGVIQPLYTGFLGVIISPESFLQKPILWLEAITQYHGTISGSPNLGYSLCTQKISSEQQQNLDLHRWRIAYSGSEPIRKKTLEEFSDKFNKSGFQSYYFFPCYGMAESTLMISGCSPKRDPVYFNAELKALGEGYAVEADLDNKNNKQIVGCGHALLDTDIRIVDPNNLSQCLDNQVGEVWVHSSSVAQGYWNQEEKTVETFQAKLIETGSKNFLRTGDLGFMRDRELFITSRLKDLVIIWGRNHCPQDIEYSVQQSHTALRLDCGAAFVIEVDDQEKLAIVQEIERTFLRNLRVEEVVSAIRESVSLNHDLQVYAIALIKPASIPKTSSGKIQRYACRQKFLQRDLAIVGEWRQNAVNIDLSLDTQASYEGVVDQETIENWLIAKIANSLGLDPEEIDPEESLASYGLDSSVALGLTCELGSWLNLELETILFWEYPKISRLAAYLADEVVKT